MPDDNKRIADAVVQLWNTGDPEVAAKVYTDHAQRSDPNQPEPTRSVKALSHYIAEVRTGFPDFKLEITDRISEGNRLVTHWTCTGTHKGDFQGIHATGKRIKINGIALARIEKGKIAEEHVYFDRFTMLEQLGVAPPMAQTAAQPLSGKAKRAGG